MIDFCGLPWDDSTFAVPCKQGRGANRPSTDLPDERRLLFGLPPYFGPLLEALGCCGARGNNCNIINGVLWRLASRPWQLIRFRHVISGLLALASLNLA